MPGQDIAEIAGVARHQKLQLPNLLQLIGDLVQQVPVLSRLTLGSLLPLFHSVQTLIHSVQTLIHSVQTLIHSVQTL